MIGQIFCISTFRLTSLLTDSGCFSFYKLSGGIKVRLHGISCYMTQREMKIDHKMLIFVNIHNIPKKNVNLSCCNRNLFNVEFVYITLLCNFS